MMAVGEYVWFHGWYMCQPSALMLDLKTSGYLYRQILVPHHRPRGASTPVLLQYYLQIIPAELCALNLT